LVVGDVTITSPNNDSITIAARIAVNIRLTEVIGKVLLTTPHRLLLAPND
jgi:hypothetical protein